MAQRRREDLLFRALKCAETRVSPRWWCRSEARIRFRVLAVRARGDPNACRARVALAPCPALRHTRCSPSGLSTSASSHERGPPRWKARPVSHNSVEGSGREFSLEPWEGAGCALRAASTALSALNLSVSLTVPLTGRGSRVGVLPRGGMYVSGRHQSFPLISQNGFRPVSPHISI